MAAKRLVRPLIKRAKPEPREYQKDAVNQIKEEFAGTTSVMLQAPTGSGKTEIALSLAEDYDKVLFVTSRANLIEQTVERANSYGMRSSRINGQKPMVEWPTGIKILVGHPRAIQNRILDNPKSFPDLIILDEAHHAAHRNKVPTTRTNQYTQILSRAINMGSKVVGMTATPIRLEEELGFDRFFGSLVCVPEAKSLIEQGYLADITIIQNDLMHGGSAHEKKLEVGINGDFTERSITSVEYYQNYLSSALDFIAKEFRYNSDNPVHSLIYCVTQQQAAEVAMKLKADYPKTKFGMVVSNSSYYKEPADRGVVVGEDALFLMRDKEIDVLINVAVLIEGADFPTVEGLACIRPTKSQTLWRQIAGRLSRPADGKKDGILLDVCGNTQRLTHPYSYLAWSLQSAADRSKKDPALLDALQKIRQLEGIIEAKEGAITDLHTKLQKMKETKYTVIREISAPEVLGKGATASPFSELGSAIQAAKIPATKVVTTPKSVESYLMPPPPPELKSTQKEETFNSTYTYNQFCTKKKKKYEKDRIYPEAGTITIDGYEYRVGKKSSESSHWWFSVKTRNGSPTFGGASDSEEAWEKLYDEYKAVTGQTVKAQY